MTFKWDLKTLSCFNDSDLAIIKNDKFRGTRSELLKNSISIGNELSFSLGLKIKDKITIMSPSGVETIIGSMPKQKTFEIINFRIICLFYLYCR